MYTASGAYANQCTQVGWLADANNCDLYFKCYTDNYGELAQTTFNLSDICSCSLYVRNCSKSGTPPKTSAPIDNSICVGKPEGYYAALNDCKSYYYCYNNVVYPFNCGTANSGWAKDFFCSNSTYSSSIMNSPTVTSQQTSSGSYVNQCTSVGWLADSKNCDLYFKCYTDNNGQLAQTTFNLTDICSCSQYNSCTSEGKLTTLTTVPSTSTQSSSSTGLTVSKCFMIIF